MVNRADPRNSGFAACFALAAVTVAVAAGGLRRCLHRTADLARQTRHLTTLSRTDPLTGLPNRRHVEEHLAAALSAARRHQQPVSVLFIDIDSFKGINDRWGYEAGDDVLRAVGQRIRDALRAEDLVGRWGGEEFLAVLPATALAGAEVVGERVRSAVACQAAGGDDADTMVTVSVGCASGADNPADLVRQAGRALGQAKAAGKNQVVGGEPPG